MRTFKFFNPQNTVVVDVETDVINDSNDNLTIHDVNFIKGGKSDLVSLGFNLDILSTDRTSLKALAGDLNFSLDEIDPVNRTSALLNEAVPLEIENVPLMNGSVAVAEVVTVTCPATAAVSQGDFIILTTKKGVSYACWLDKDSAGTAPVGTLFSACTYKIKVGIATGDTAIVVAGKFKAAVESDPNWNGFEVITNSGDGTLVITQSDEGVVVDPVCKNAAEDSVGSFSFVVSVSGSGDYLEQLTSVGGNGIKTYSIVSGTLPVGFTLSPEGAISGTTTSTGYFAVMYKVTDYFGQVATKELTITIL